MAMNQQMRNEMIRNLASLSEKDLQQAIHDTAVKLVGMEDEERLAQREAQLNTEVKAYNNMHVDAIAADYAQQRVKTTTTINDQGFSGQSTQVQAKLGTVGDTAFFGHATVNQDKTGSLGSVNVGVNAVGTPHRVGDWHVLPVGRLETSVPVSGGEFGAKNVTGVAGAIFAPHDSKLNITAAAVSDAAFTDPSLYVRASGTAYEGEVTVTPYAETVVGMRSGNVAAGAGMRVDKDLGDGYGAYAQGAVAASGLTNGDMDFSGQATLGVMWGGASKKESSLESAMSALVPSNEHASPPVVTGASSTGYRQSASGYSTSAQQHFYNEAPRQSGQQVSADEAQMDKLMSKASYSKVMETAYEFYKELADQPQAQQQFMAHMGRNLAEHNPAIYDDAADAQRSLQLRFNNQDYLAQRHQSEEYHAQQADYTRG